MEEKDKSLFKYNGKTYKLVKQPGTGDSCKDFCSLDHPGCENLCVKAYSELDNPDFGLIDAVFVEVDESENKETIMKDIEIDYKKLYEEEHKKYEDALGRARGHHSVASHYNNADEIQELEHIFPELKEKESEDEKVRKSIIKLLQVGGYMSPEDKDKAFAWLKKQGHDGKKWIYEDVYLKEKEQLFQDGLNEVLENPQKYGLKKQDEQKSTDIPKFKVDDWVINSDGKIRHIIGVDESGYQTDYGWLTHDSYEREFHLWTIQDAKDGDILVASDGSIFLLKGVIDGACKDYVALTIDNVLAFNEGLEHYWETSTSVHPATKEQHDILFQKMKEAGYEWDTEKKELKKIEQKSVDKVKPKFTSGDYIRYRGENYEIKDIEETKDGFIYNVSIIGKPSDPEEVKTAIGFAAEQDIVKIEHHTWSEEDEEMFGYALDMIEWYSGKNENKSRLVSDWLKSLKERVQLQPQSKQELNEEVVNECVDLGLPSGTLWKPYNEEGYYTYDEAVNKFSDNLPSKEQWEELKDKCKWKWKDNGYKVTGLNGNTIFLPAKGCRFGTKVHLVDTYGIYWSSTYYGEEYATANSGYRFDNNDIGMYEYDHDYGLSVRLVK